jgi:hypothetical protein
MSKKAVSVVVAAVLAFGLAGGAVAGNIEVAIPVNWRVAGTVVNVQVAPPAAGPVAGFLIQALVKGSPGNAQFTVVGIPNSAPAPLQQCNGGFGQTFSPNDMVVIFDDLSMLFAELGEGGGWICFPGAAGDPVTAVANMIVTGGTGRFEGTGGGFVGVFEGHSAGISGALSAETGTITGQILR